MSKVNYTYDVLGRMRRRILTVGSHASSTEYAYLPSNDGTATTPLICSIEQLGKATTYTYGDANWRDKLTAYNGQPISYDPIGNPLNDGTWHTLGRPGGS